MFNPLEKLLSSRARAEVFRLLFDEPAELYMRDMERKTGLAIGSIQKVLKELNSLELVVSRQDGNRLYYSANHQHLLYPDIHSIVVKTVGSVGILSKSLADDAVKCAFIFGSVARHKERAQSDIDLFVIGDMGLRRLTELLSPAKGQIAREINPHIMTKAEFIKRRRAKNHFVIRVLEGDKIFIKGSEDELEKMG